MIYRCETFLDAPVESRLDLAKRADVCQNCLGKGHLKINCKVGLCRKCNGNHHTVLHLESSTNCVQPLATQVGSTNSISLSISTNNCDIIPTATKNVMDHDQNQISCRAIIDTGSTINFITKDMVEKLKLKTSECHVPIGALNDMAMVVNEFLNITILSRMNTYKKSINFIVVPTITSNIPDQYYDVNLFNIPPNINLADPEFYKPAPIQMLLGVGVFLSILCVGQIKLSDNIREDLSVQKTSFGWIVGGNTHLSNKYNKRSYLMNIDNDLSRFWELEEKNLNNKIFSDEELKCEEHYKKYVQRNRDGSYVVALPFNDKKDQVGSSRDIALKRLISLEKRLHKDQELYSQYKQIINEYLELQHMIKLKGNPFDGFFYPITLSLRKKV